jgi:phosphotransferase family enzyme
VPADSLAAASRGRAVADIGLIIERLEPLLGPLDGEAVPLAGGITNRNYRARLGDVDYVVRLPGKDTALLGISRDAERVASEAAAALGIAPPVAAALDECLVTRFVPCRPVTPAELRASPAEVGAALRAFHDGAPPLPARFWVPELLEDYAATTLGRGRALPDDYARAREIGGRIAAALPLIDPVPCHDDLLTANLIRAQDDGSPGRVLLVDWEYAGMGHRLFDLGNLSVNNEFDDDADRRLLAAYFGEEPSASRRAALRLMRVMSDVREAAWGVVQGAISELDFDFAAYAAQHFERLNAAASDPRFEEWLNAASA